MTYKIEIKLKLPSCNDYIRACRTNKIVGAKMKQNVESQIYWYIKDLPKFTKPIQIDFSWIEGTKRRDYDNIAFRQKVYLRRTC